MIELADVSFAYPGGAPVLEGVSLTVASAERVVVLGCNGSGKSTLGRLINGSFVPQSGHVAVDGREGSLDGRGGGLARMVGYVRQDPRDQIVSSVVSDEVAFGPRNLGLSREEVLARVDEALDLCGISELRDRMTNELSGGQQQLLAIAGVVAMHPSYLVLDEICSHLDEAARERVTGLVDALVARGAGVMDIAHSAEALFGADRVVVLKAGGIVWSGSPEGFLASDTALKASGLAADPLARVLAQAVGRGYALSDRPDPEGLAAYVGDLFDGGAAAGPSEDRGISAAGTHELSCADVHLSYEDVEALSGVSLRAHGLTVVLGRSGSGKTTLGGVLAGVLEPDSGVAELDGRELRAGDVGLAFQRPEDQLFCDTVLDDIAYGPRMRGKADEEALDNARAAAELLGLGEELLGRSPFELSGGQMRRAALAGVVACGQDAYVLDEPTAGLDAESRAELRALVRGLAADGAAVVVITHDAGEWLADAAQVVLLREGRVVAVADPLQAARDPALYEAAGITAPFSVRLRAACEGGAHA